MIRPPFALPFAQLLQAVAALALSIIAPPALAQEDLLARAIQDRPATAVAAADEAAQGDPAEWRRQADLLAEQQRYDEAISLYERAYRLDPANQEGYARLLIARRAAGRLSPAEQEALALIEEGRDLQIEEVIRSVRLGMVQAREALRHGDAELAASQIAQSREKLAGLPRGVDVAPYHHELARLEAAARRRNARPPAGAAVAGNPGDAGVMPLPPVDGAVRVPNNADVDPAGPYAPNGRFVDPDDLTDLAADDPSFRYQRAIARAAAAARTQRFLDVEQDVAELNNDGPTYPDDWPQRTARRARYRHGEIYRGPSTKNENGEEVYTAIYDLGDLVHPVPNFASLDWDPRIRAQAVLDRDAIRRYSWMFRGDAADLAAGLPVLQFYGGIDNWAAGPRTDPAELERVLITIDAFMQGR